MSVILMYHALFADDAGFDRIAVEDQPYAVSTENFRTQLARLAALRTGLIAHGQAPPDVVLTFDDGHVSNYDLALPILAEFGMQAYFFITTDFTDQREHFCSSEQLRAMHQAGMVIGSHGKTHAFFADLSEHEALHEFQASKDKLESITGAAVESISFPGGRYQKDNVKQAAKLGYSQVFGSGFGTVDVTRYLQTKEATTETTAKEADATPAAVLPVTVLPVINRIPIRLNTSMEVFEKIVTGDRSYYLKERAKYSSKEALKRLLGNKSYHALYKYAAERR